jgi:hypothetical protein
MRTRIQFLLSGVLLLGLLSCSKDNDPAPNSNIEGLWVGTYAVDGYPNLGQQYFSYVIKADGTLVTDSKGSGKQNLCTGTWILNGTTVAFSYAVVYSQAGDEGIVQTSTATWDKASKLTGAYQNSNGDNSTGTFTLTKVN